MKNAFTLAEVLITLTIIGVIAALTIPNLMQKWQKQATITKLSKGYNAITRMANNLKQNTNCDDLECTGLFNVPTQTDNTSELQKEFINLAKIKDAKLYRTQWRFPVILSCEKTGCGDSIGSFADFFATQDGLIYSVSKDETNKLIFISLIIEPVQNVIKNGGDRKTLKVGRNVFFFTINNNLKASPYSTPSTCTQNQYGWGCAAKIIADGWKINY